MDIATLKLKIAELLNVSKENSELAFEHFKSSIRENLSIGEAIKLEGLGIFQLKEHATAAKELQQYSLVFSPENIENITEPLFINIDLSDENIDETEISDDVFQIGLNKKLVTEVESASEDQSNTEISESVNKLIENAEKIQNFDLWEDHFKNKESKDILPELQEKDRGELQDLVEYEDISEDKISSDDFTPLTEEERLKEIMDETEMASDDDILEHADEPLELDLTKRDSDSLNINDSIDDNIDDTIDELTSEIDKEMDVEDLAKNISFDEEPIEEDYDKIDEIELESKVDELVEDLELKDVVTEEDDDKKEENKESENKDETQKEDKELPPIETLVKPNEGVKVKYKHKRKGHRTVNYLLLALFLIVASIGIYYLFIDNLTWLYDEHELQLKVNHQLDEKTNELNSTNLSTNNYNKDESTVEKSSNTAENKIKNNESKKVLTKNNNVKKSPIPSEKKIDANIKSTKSKISAADVEKKKIVSSSNKNISKETEVADNIYFDGAMYSVQVSSWQREEIAKREVQKLSRRGFPAYHVSAYIDKFKSTWHRVRLGPFVSLEEAKKIQKKIK